MKLLQQICDLIISTFKYIEIHVDFFTMVILALTLFVLCVYAYDTNRISKEAIRTNQLNAQPLLGLGGAGNSVTNIINVGKGTALNIIHIFGKKDEISMSEADSVIGGIPIGKSFDLKHIKLVKTSKEDLIKKIPEAKDIIEKIHEQDRWTCLIYEDVFGNKFATTQISPDYGKSLDFKKISTKF